MFDDGCTELETYNTRWHTRTLYANPTDFTYLNIQKWITLQWTIKDSSIRGLSIRLHSHDSCSHDRSVCSAWSLISSKSGDSNLLSALPPNHWVTFSYFSSWQLPTTTCMLDYSIKSSGMEHMLAALQSVIQWGTLSAFYILWHAVRKGSWHNGRDSLFWLFKQNKTKESKGNTL